jgi:hypothetical protein
MLGGMAGGSGLGGVGLGFSQADDGLDQGREAEHEGDLGEVQVAGDKRQGGQLAGCAAQALPAGVGWGTRP